ncbi:MULTISPECIES: hypothetical protein [Methylosinus]|uniref:Uncharacterized protein n=1 Tax=Methylosinus trichosporium (strain ATCC 35070 / NCIMB 11131 / UNIQEM 75 / OB3b) TaxID=595536 RepID=A0A2D2D483_METT3|nr:MULTISPECIES: hypothetical protein [Methylosinus]ATQ69679.1 hypothetical protein CQW49_18675 [Methylosinus trichosporium OB3b]OBS51233.1 hypothetical protein A8B73_17420 [Methylosinus sp. 3S-1]
MEGPAGAFCDETEAVAFCHSGEAVERAGNSLAGALSPDCGAVARGSGLDTEPDSGALGGATSIVASRAAGADASVVTFAGAPAVGAAATAGFAAGRALSTTVAGRLSNAAPESTMAERFTTGAADCRGTAAAASTTGSGSAEESRGAEEIVSAAPFACVCGAAAAVCCDVLETKVARGADGTSAAGGEASARTADSGAEGARISAGAAARVAAGVTSTFGVALASTVGEVEEREADRKSVATGRSESLGCSLVAAGGCGSFESIEAASGVSRSAGMRAGVALVFGASSFGGMSDELVADARGRLVSVRIGGSAARIDDASTEAGGSCGASAA